MASRIHRWPAEAVCATSALHQPLAKLRQTGLDCSAAALLRHAGQAKALGVMKPH